MSHSLHTAYAHHFECFCYEQRCHDVGFPASQRHNIIWHQTLEQQLYQDFYTL